MSGTAFSAHAARQRSRHCGSTCSVLEEALALAREQLTVANQRAQALERTVQERDTEGALV
jgi:hypothetical protein